MATRLTTAAHRLDRHGDLHQFGDALNRRGERAGRATRGGPDATRTARHHALRATRRHVIDTPEEFS